GICYIGGIRNNPQEVSELLNLPEHVYPVFGLCLGYPDQDPEVKPRLPLAAILKQDAYDDSDDEALVASFDDTMHQYYQERTAVYYDTYCSELRMLMSNMMVVVNM